MALSSRVIFLSGSNLLVAAPIEFLGLLAVYLPMLYTLD